MKKITALLMALAMAVAVLPVVGAETPTDNATSSGIPALVEDVDSDGVIRVACVGDSITAGTSATNYPMYLQEYLNYLGTQDGKTYEVKNHGKGGAACRHIEENVGTASWDTVTDANQDGKAYFYYDDIAYTSSLTYTPDVVIVQMGTNDALGDNWSNWNNYFADDYYNYLVKPYADKGALVIMSTPPYACNGWHTENVNGPVHDREIAIAEDLELPIVDTNRLLYGMDEVTADGLHGNVTGYSMMAMNFYKYIFGGESITLTIEAEPNTRCSFYCSENGRTYARTTDENGVATIDFIPGSYTFTNFSAECSGFKTVYMTDIAFDEDYTVEVEQEVGGFNIALSGKAFACDAELYNSSQNADTINDGSRLDPGYQTKDYHTNDYCGLMLDAKYKVNMLVLYWETADVISEYNDDGYEIYLHINDEWKAMKTVDSDVAVSRSVYSGTSIADTVSFSAATVFDGVKVEFHDGKISSRKYAPKLYELEVLADDTTPVTDGVKGDVDGNGLVEANDLTALARHLGAIEIITNADYLANADVDGEAGVGAGDLTKLARFLAQIDTAL